MLSSLENNSKHENKLRNIVQLNKVGSTIYTDATSEALTLGCSKSEFIAALKKDIDKTAYDLIESYGIIKSVKNGIVTDIANPETVNSFFDTCYIQSEDSVELAGVKFIFGKSFPEKLELTQLIYSNVLDISKKELTHLSKAITLYETTNDEVKKAILYPSLVKADELIEQIGLINTKFNDFVKKMNYKQRTLFNTTFKRSGVTEVIQNSTYIDIDGIRQCVHNVDVKPVIRKIATMLMNKNTKYIESVEIDSDGDCNKALRMINQIERLKINSEYKFTLKIRKLGNLNARGVFFQSGMVVAEDYRDTSALLHEIAHLIHLTNPAINNNKFVNYMIEKMANRYNTDNLPELSKPYYIKKHSYYTDPKEIIARTLEIASLFAFEQGRFIQGEDEFLLVKSREFYSLREGIYFDFLSFDDKTKAEMLELYKMFYETSFGETFNTYIDNFVKIDTCFKRKQKSILDIIKENNKVLEKEKKTLYSLIDSSTINLVIKNRGSLDVAELASRILMNISYCGGHNKSLHISNWAEIILDKTKVVLTLIKSVKDSLEHQEEYIEFLYQLRNKEANIINKISDAVLLQGFTLKARMSIKKIMKEMDGYEQFLELASLKGLISKTPLLLANKEVLSRKSFIYQLIDIDPSLISFINENNELDKQDFIDYVLYYLDNFPNKDFRIKDEIILSDIRILRKIVESKSNYNELNHLSDPFYKLGIFIDIVSSKFPDSIIEIFKKVGENLINDFEFMSRYVLLNSELINYVGPEIKHLFQDGIEKPTVIEVEINTCKSSIETPVKIKTKKVTKNKTQTIEVSPIVNDERFQKILQNVEITEKPHSKSGEMLKIFKVDEDLGTDFQAFATYVNKNDIAYYSKFIKAFVVKNIELIASVTTSMLYSNEQIQIFSSGKLF